MDEQHPVGDTDASQTGSGDQSFTDPSGMGETHSPTDTSQSEGTPDPGADVTQEVETGTVPSSESSAPPNPTGSTPPAAGLGDAPESYKSPSADPMVSAKPPEGIGVAPEGAVTPGEPASGGAPGNIGTGGGPAPAGNAPPIASQSIPPEAAVDPPPPGQTTAGAVDASHPAQATALTGGEPDEPDQIATERPDIGTE